MPHQAQVFISCGQHTQEENDITEKVAGLIQSKGFKPWVAKKIKTLLDINGDIIGALKSSDYYLFINSRRERINTQGDAFYRDSVFTNQELAIAYAMGFDQSNILMLNQSGVKKEGLFRYLGTNTDEFSDTTELLALLNSSITDARWHPTFSRNLIPSGVVAPAHFDRYNHEGWHYHPRVFRIRINNHRRDRAALGATLRFRAYRESRPPVDIRLEHFERSDLKVSGRRAYSTAIWPESFVDFDLFGVDRDSPNVFLHSSTDIGPIQPVLQNPGHFRLEYELFAENFPKLNFEIDLTGHALEATADLVP